MESTASICTLVKDPLSIITRNSRRAKPLHAIGLSVLKVAHRAYTRAETSLGPIGYIVAKIASPIVYSLEYQWLASLSFTDSQILAIEYLAETIFPPASYVFDVFYLLIHTTTSMLTKFENVVDHFPDPVPLLHFVMMQDEGVAAGIEKEVATDIHCRDHADELGLVQTKPMGQLYDDGPTYVQNEIEPITPSSMKESSLVNLEGAKTDEDIRGDPILELFAEGWYMR